MFPQVIRARMQFTRTEKGDRMPTLTGTFRAVVAQGGVQGEDTHTRMHAHTYRHTQKRHQHRDTYTRKYERTDTHRHTDTH